MRALVLLLLPAVALADASIPSQRGDSLKSTAARTQTHCAARLEVARTEVAAMVPAFANAVIEESPAPGSLTGAVERVELRLDETLAPAAHAYLIIAQVQSRRNLWTDDSRTEHTWRSIATGSQYRQTPRFEGQVAIDHSTLSPLTVQRILELYLKPAVDDCLRHFD
jgi:hypothetical protein